MKDFDKESVMQIIADMTAQKVNEVGQNKEPIKAALSQDMPIYNILANKSKEPQSKGFER